MELTLSGEEHTLLGQILERYLSLMREEIGKTENYRMRQELKSDEVVLKGMIARLKGVAA